jgi:2-polyprenyl-6-methoxyphenol hydroxylase-like FAD-dependent oxidoreductase
MKEHSTDVLIVGAGPTGLLLACELARQGVSFRLIDRSARPSKLSRGTGIHSRSLEILDDLGLIDRIVDQGSWLPATSIYRDRELLRRIPLDHNPTPTEPYPSILILEQAKAERILTEALAAQGVEIERRCELRNFTQFADGVSVTLARKKMLERWNCRYIVGCDGPKSRVREILGIDFAGFTYPRPYLLAEVEMKWDLPPEMHRFLGDSVDLLAVPLGGDLFRLTAWENAPEDTSENPEGETLHRTMGAAPSLEQVQEMLDRTVPGISKAVEARTLLRYRIESRLASSYGSGRAFIAGDACHVHPPTGSQGLNTGFQDAYNLGWKLAAVVKGESPQPLLHSYESERRPVGHWVLNNTNQAATSRFELAGRRFFMMGNKFLMARWNQLSVNYRDSSIVAQMERVTDSRALQAGDRAPDGLVMNSKEESKRLFELFRGCQHHLLVFSGVGIENLLEVVTTIQDRYARWIEVHLIGEPSEGWPSDKTWSDPEGGVAQAYSVREATAILVRPDGYVGARVGKYMGQQFLLYLEGCFALATEPQA